ncbi:MAG: cation-translocating P-type ATPase [Phycisphaeraceae bacterium]|nr:cation-translocating P-type ATPase [Phycisphaeraceae bacterium]
MNKGSESSASGVFSPRGELRGAILAGVLLAIGWVARAVSDGAWASVPVWASLGIGLVYGGRAAFDALRSGAFNIDVLMVLGAVFAAIVGHPDEGALLLFLFVLAGALEELAMQRTEREVRALSALMPTQAIVWRGGEWLEAEPETLEIGERVKVRPGERVPADARVVLGSTSMDQATLTGESVPREVGVGETIYAGTINVENPIECEVIRRASESSVQKVLDLVLTAREQREPVQRAIDRISQPYAVGVTIVSVVVAAVWMLVLGRDWRDASYTAITFLIVCSPCALVIATPTATLAAIARGASSGVLFKGGQTIERLARVRAVCFDKTGTLTVGRPRLEAVMPVGWSDPDALLAVASALEQESTHPIAAAVRDGAAARGVASATLKSVTHEAGRGMAGMVGGVRVRLGSYPHTEEIIPVCLRANTRETLERIRSHGRIGIVVAGEGAEGVERTAAPEHAGGAAVLVLRDAVRPGAKRLVTHLHEMGVRPVKMLTGDNRTTASFVAKELGLDEFEAELMPADKLRLVHEIKERLAREGNERASRRGGVAVIGDGVNDAPALAAADVSVAIGSIGSDAALETADIVLLNDDLSAVGWAIELARRARRTVAVNLVFALSVIVAMGVATLVGSAIGRRVPLGIGVLAHEGGTLLVVANSLRLLIGPAFRAGRVSEPRAETEYESATAAA